MAKKSKMSDEHKAALAKGRAQGAKVRAYLRALEDHQPKRGRKRTPESIRRQISAIEQQMPDATAEKRLVLVQRRRDLEADLEHLDSRSEIDSLEADFVDVAAEYGERKGIEYATWREVGVPAATLKKAGITRGS